MSGGNEPGLWWEVWFIDRHELPDWVNLKEGFGHVFLLGYQPMSLTFLLVDWKGSKCDVLGMVDYQAEAIREYARRLNGTCVIAKEHQKTGLGFELPALYCVGMVKKVLGLTGMNIWTPHQLYRALLSRPDAYVLEANDG